MTNSEAKAILNKINPFIDDSEKIQYFEAIELMLGCFEENDKLKAEIEQLKQRLEIKDHNFELYSDVLDEIEQLKAELEQSIKLPCKLKDTVYEVVECDDGAVRIFEMKVCNVCGYGSFHNGSKKKFVWNVYMEDEKGFGYSYGTFYDFGKTIFLSREEAEQHLKGGAE